MAGYFVANVDITDAVGFKEYAAGAPATVAAYGGSYLVRGGVIEVLEGDWTPTRITIIQFESVARVKEWFNSPEYLPFKEIRKKTTVARLLVIQGV